MGRNPATGETIRIKASKKARITPVKAFKDAVLAPSTAPKLKKGAYPIDAAAVAAAGKSAAVAPVRATVAKAPAKKAPSARKATAAKKAAAGQEGARRQEVREERTGRQEGSRRQEGRPPRAGARKPSSEHADRLSPAMGRPRRSVHTSEPIAERPLEHPARGSALTFAPLLPGDSRSSRWCASMRIHELRRSPHRTFRHDRGVSAGPWLLLPFWLSPLPLRVVTPPCSSASWGQPLRWMRLMLLA